MCAQFSSCMYHDCSLRCTRVLFFVSCVATCDLNSVFHRHVSLMDAGDEIASIRDLLLSHVLAPVFASAPSNASPSSEASAVHFHSVWVRVCAAFSLTDSSASTHASLCVWSSCMAAPFARRLAESVREVRIQLSFASYIFISSAVLTLRFFPRFGVFSVVCRCTCGHF